MSDEPDYKSLNENARRHCEVLRSEIHQLSDKLDAALCVLWRHGDNGAKEWLRLNYPGFANAIRVEDSHE